MRRGLRRGETERGEAMWGDQFILTEIERAWDGCDKSVHSVEFHY